MEDAYDAAARDIAALAKSKTNQVWIGLCGMPGGRNGKKQEDRGRKEGEEGRTEGWWCGVGG
jgi:hypothetical protein